MSGFLQRAVGHDAFGCSAEPFCGTLDLMNRLLGIVLQLRTRHAALAFYLRGYTRTLGSTTR